jgi:hypothetical protein
LVRVRLPLLLCIFSGQISRANKYPCGVKSALTWVKSMVDLLFRKAMERAPAFGLRQPSGAFLIVLLEAGPQGNLPRVLIGKR